MTRSPRPRADALARPLGHRFEILILLAFGKSEQVKRVFWTLFIVMAGLVLARVVDPATAQQVVGIIMGMGG